MSALHFPLPIFPRSPLTQPQQRCLLSMLSGLLLLLLLLLLLPAAAQAQRITVDIDRTEATIDEQLLLRVTVEGREEVPPKLPELPAFTVRFQGRSSQFQLLNGRSSASYTYAYLLMPKEVGSFTFGPATVEVDGRAFTSEPFRIRILPASAQPQDNRELFVRAFVSTTSPYVGQQVIFTWRFYHRVNIDSPRLDPMTFDGFLVENLGEVRQYDDTVNGQRFRISEIRKALFPQEVGTVTIDPLTLYVQLIVQDPRRRSFFGGLGTSRSKPQVLSTQPIDLEVRPLPPAPADFGGLVGSFDLTARLSQREITVGDSATLTLEVSGTGNVRSISQPPLPELPNFKIYEDQPKSSVNRNRSGLSGSKTYGLALVPGEAGEQRLPPLSLTYFDPKEGTYRTERTPEMTLSVLPSDGSESLNLTEAFGSSTGKVAVRMLDDDILPLSTDLSAVTPPAFASPSDPWLTAGLALPPLAWLGLWGWVRRRRRWARDSALRRRSGAVGQARRALDEIRRNDAQGAASAADAGSRCLRALIGDLLNIEGTALTPEEAAANLRAAAVDDELVERVRRCLERLEAAQYGTGAASPDAVVNQVEPLIQALHRALPHPGDSRNGRTAAATTSGALLLALGSLLASLLAPLPSAATTAPLESPLELPAEAPADALSVPDTELEIAQSPVESPTPATPSLATDDPRTLFLRAAEAYGEQRYEDSVVLYQRLTAAGHAGPDLWYNLGNAALRSGRLGAAIASYRRALALQPTHQETLANLSFARSLVKDDIAPPQPSALTATLLFWHYRLGRPQLATAVVALNGLLWLVATGALLAPVRWRRTLRWSAAGIAVVVLLLGVSLTLRFTEPRRVAVIQPQEAEARTAPQSSAVVRFRLHAGTEVTVEEVREPLADNGNAASNTAPETANSASSWIRIALPDGQQGWVSAAAVEIIEL